MHINKKKDFKIIKMNKIMKLMIYIKKYAKENEDISYRMEKHITLLIMET